MGIFASVFIFNLKGVKEMKAAVYTAVSALYSEKSKIRGEGCNNNRQRFVSATIREEATVCAQ